MCLEGAYNKLDRSFSLCPFSFEPALGQIARARSFSLLSVSVSPTLASYRAFSFLAYETYPNDEEVTDVDYDVEFT